MRRSIVLLSAGLLLSSLSVPAFGGSPRSKKPRQRTKPSAIRGKARTKLAVPNRLRGLFAQRQIKNVARARATAGKNPVIVHSIPLGTHVQAAAREMLALANKEKRVVASDFNGRPFFATPGDTHREVMSTFGIKPPKDVGAHRARLMAELLPNGLIHSLPAKINLDPRGFTKARPGEPAMARLTFDQLTKLPRGTVLYNKFGAQRVVGVDGLLTHTADGFTIYGVPRSRK